MKHPDLRETEAQWRARIAAFIAQGWGSTPQGDIPWDWQHVRGPDPCFGAEHKAASSAGRKLAWQRQRRERGSGRRAMLDARAQQMRLKYGRKRG